MKRACKILLDSGAFTFWKRGVSAPSLEQYGRYLEANREWYDLAVSMDVIPGIRAKQASPLEIEEAAKLSLKNAEELRRMGHQVIPVFHRREDIRWLDKILDGGWTYIGLGGITTTGTERRIAWGDRVFKKISKYPGVKVHGFGATAEEVLRRFPWTSVDSATWGLRAGFGAVIVKIGGRWVQFRASQFEVIKGAKSNVRRQGPLVRESIVKYLESIGHTWDDLFNTTIRTVICAKGATAQAAECGVTLYLCDMLGGRRFGMEALNLAKQSLRLISYHQIIQKENSNFSLRDYTCTPFPKRRYELSRKKKIKRVRIV